MPMTASEPPPPERRGGLIVPVPEAEATVVPWLERYVPIWHFGVPAHVTLLLPFPSLTVLDASTFAELTALFATTPQVRVTFSEVGTFPDVVYLSPEPREWFLALTERLSRRFGLLPYDGLHRELIPHMTVARHSDPAVLAEIAASVARQLPIEAVAREVWLMEDLPDGRWHHSATFPLGAP